MVRYISSLIFLVFASSFGQQTEYVDFKTVLAELYIHPVDQSVMGTVEFRFDILKSTDTIFIDAIDMEMKGVLLNNSEVEAIQTDKKLILIGNFAPAQNNTLQFTYVANPKKALYFIDNESYELNIWTQGQGKYTSHWLPSFDDMNEKLEFDITVIFDDSYSVIASGVLTEKVDEQDFYRWKFNMNKPMSSYLVALAIGKYSKHVENSNSGIPLEFYFHPNDSSKVEPTYRYSKQMFDFLEEEIGVAYPWEIYKQVPVKDFLYSGMENTSLTIFSDALVTDSIGFKDRNYVNVNGHELAHQWFGNLVTEKSGTHHWLQEGFATYYALLAERDIFGDEYYYWKLYDYSQQLLQQEKAGESTSLLNPESSSLTFYQKGCWALHVLKEQVGETVFKDAVKNYLLKYQYKNVETSDFIEEVEKSSGQDLTEFVKIWLETLELPQDAMVESLKKSEFIQEYLDVDCEIYPSKCNDYLVSDISDKAKVKIVSQESYTIKQEDFSNGWEVRQAIAQNLVEIPSELKKSYESLLNDKSYVTIESALYNLWNNFPEERSKYLHQTKDIIGFSDYNVRLLWLALNLNTIEYRPEKKQMVFEELKNYTAPRYGFEIRMNAFGYLKLINGFDEVSLKNLIEATDHHNWRFKQFAKNLLGELRENPRYSELTDKTIKQ